MEFAQNVFNSLKNALQEAIRGSLGNKTTCFTSGAGAGIVPGGSDVWMRIMRCTSRLFHHAFKPLQFSRKTCLMSRTEWRILQWLLQNSHRKQTMSFRAVNLVYSKVRGLCPNHSTICSSMLHQTNII